MSALIPAADLEPTAEQTATERARFARCADYVEARGELAPSTVHIEDLAAALADGRTLTVATMVRAMLAARRAYVERRAELDDAAAARRAEPAVDAAPAADPDAEIRRLAELTAAERVARGAAKLDEGMPGWAELLEPAHIDMRYVESDVVSLLRYSRTLSDAEDAALDAIDENDLTYGLTIKARAGEPVAPLWDELRDLWRAEIERRTGGAA